MSHLIYKIINNIINYSQSDLGNYIIQFVLKTFPVTQKAIKELITAIFKNIIRLSTNKYSSNILIKIVESFEKLRARAINELFHNSKLYMLAKNKYGLLVLESFIKYLSSTEKVDMKSIIVKRFKKDERTNKDVEKLNQVLDMLK